MLRVKRASAGSGKTYELAKTYIKMLISAKLPGYRRQLMAESDSLRENLGSILAVTFTVKATAEMKQRIVDKLAELATADDPAKTPKELEKMDYLKEFMEDFNATPAKIAVLARKALRTLLLHYSDFKVQTIDSFFQSILHTFTYEASIDENFNMEMNADYAASVGFDRALDDISAGGNAGNVLRWLRELIESNLSGNQWNVFSRGGGRMSLYNRLINEARNLQKEDFHEVRDRLYGYLDLLSSPDAPMSFSEVIDTVDEANIGPWKAYHEEVRVAAVALRAELRALGLDYGDLPDAKKRGKRLLHDCAGFSFAGFRPPIEITKVKGAGFSLGKEAKKKVKAAAEQDPVMDFPSMVESVDSAYDGWMEASNRFYQTFQPERERVATWLAYRRLLPVLMLVLEISKRTEEYLRGANSLQISDTAHIISKIIGEDDAPFVYERMGSKIAHYLIDEFQDTSRLQWRNLRPLLRQSESLGNDNLIIGDAKQSIYRFRNADSTLISGLEKEFDKVVSYTQEKEPESGAVANTNYRSKPNVVRFNNYVFEKIVGLESCGFTPAIKDVYSDCVQTLPKLEDGEPELSPGYVEMVFSKKARTDDMEEDESLRKYMDLPGVREIPGKIVGLVSRGYRFRDIGILVKKHEIGLAVVKTVAEYNKKHPKAKIKLISEEDLLVASSYSVRLIVHALELLSGIREESDASADSAVSPFVTGEQLDRLMEMVHTMALPSVVEAAIALLLPASRRNDEAVFLAAFQDAVIDFCSSSTGDIGQFLKWWDRKSKSLSIASPEGTDGVALQTIHKSKGLEYKCVIIPDAHFLFEPYHEEWKWVRTDQRIKEGNLLPEYLPVETSKSLRDTWHADVYEKYREDYALDELNKMYVAFTRAAWELYAYVQLPGSRGSASSSKALRELLDPARIEESGHFESGISVEEVSDERLEVRYGSPVPRAEIEAFRNKELAKKQRRKVNPVLITGYETNGRVGGKPVGEAVHPGGDPGEISPKAEGSLKHRVMEWVRTRADLPKAMRRLRVEGVISDAQAREWETELDAAMESESHRGWFDPDVTVLSERSIISREVPRIHRPDRVVVDKDNNAVVIDYKFGARDSGEHAGYEKQVGEYAALLRATGRFRTVSAFLWYMGEGLVEEVK